jgi:hypothetical protein
MHGIDIIPSNVVYLAARNHMDILRLLFENMSSSMADTSHRRATADALRVSAVKQSLEVVVFLLEKLIGASQNKRFTPRSCRHCSGGAGGHSKEVRVIDIFSRNL